MRLVEEEVAKEARRLFVRSLPERKHVNYSKALVVGGVVEIVRLVSKLQMAVSLRWEEAVVSEEAVAQVADEEDYSAAVAI